MIDKNYTPYKLFPLEAKNIAEMRALFRATVLHVNIQHYTREEVEDWASCGDKLERWKELMSVNQYVGAFNECDDLVGFASMNEQGYLHSMFVDKDWQGKGVATRLLAEVENMARRWGVSEITVDVSVTAKAFFENKGYETVRKQLHKANRLELVNFFMRKKIGDGVYRK